MKEAILNEFAYNIFSELIVNFPNYNFFRNLRDAMLFAHIRITRSAYRAAFRAALFTAEAAVATCASHAFAPSRKFVSYLSPYSDIRKRGCAVGLDTSWAQCFEPIRRTPNMAALPRGGSMRA